MRGGIYAIVNKVNGKRYIGSAVDFSRRFNKHRTELRCGRHHCSHLYRAWRKHGEQAFEFRRLLVCKTEHLVMYEQRAIDAYVGMLYNTSPTAGSQLGVKRTAETRRKQSIAATGRKMSPESVAKTRAANLGRPSDKRGAPLPPDVRAKVSATLKARGSRLPKDHPMMGWWHGKTREHSEETRQKISASLRGRPGRPCKNALELARQRARFSAEQVVQMREQRAAGATFAAIANEFGAGQSTVHRIVTGRNYRHLEE